MYEIKHSLEGNATLLKAKVSKQALYGLAMAVSAIVVASCMVALQQAGELSLSALIEAQKSNMAIWVLDTTPFLFSFWGQYTSSIISYAAGAMVLDQTNELRLRATALESKAHHESMHDTLTELPNRLLFHDRLNQTLNREDTAHHPLAVMVINIKGFKEINDGLGQHNADRLLKQFSVRLEGMLQERDTAARLSGDEFAIMITSEEDVNEPAKMASRMQRTLMIPFEIDRISIDVHASIGIALYPQHGADADTLMQRATVAMHAAKQQEREFVVYATELDKNSPHKLILMSELRYAIENDSLFLHYQPKVDLSSGDVVGVEALIRWDHKKFGIISPDEFIPLAERSGLISKLTQWVINQALTQSAKWHRQHIKVPIAVNLSTIDVMNVDLPDVVASLLAVHAVDPAGLKLELTESAILSDQQRALEILNRIASQGVDIAIDDFGTGYSSLAYLSRLPVSEVKIDKSFVMSMLDDKREEAIVKTTIDLARHLNMNVVAEGIEDQEMYEHLIKLGCRTGQGFYISKPKSADDFIAWLKQYSANQVTPPPPQFVLQPDLKRSS